MNSKDNSRPELIEKIYQWCYWLRTLGWFQKTILFIGAGIFCVYYFNNFFITEYQKKVIEDIVFVREGISELDSLGNTFYELILEKNVSQEEKRLLKNKILTTLEGVAAKARSIKPFLTKNDCKHIDKYTRYFDKLANRHQLKHDDLLFPDQLELLRNKAENSINNTLDNFTFTENRIYYFFFHPDREDKSHSCDNL